MSSHQTHFTTGWKFNQLLNCHSHLLISEGNLVNFLPLSPTSHTGFDFNQTVDNIPPTLTHLKTGHCFNKQVDKLPPHSPHISTKQLINFYPHLNSTNQFKLTHLTGHAFNHPVDKRKEKEREDTTIVNFHIYQNR
jgi:hypothetical protein